MTNYVGKKVLVRGIQSGVYFGTLAAKEGQEVELVDCRNLWYWNGANNLLDIAKNGVKRPDECQFSVRVDNIVLTDICEIVPCTEEAVGCIEGVKEWMF